MSEDAILVGRRRRRLLQRFRDVREAAEAVGYDNLRLMDRKEAAVAVAAKMIELQAIDPEEDPTFDWEAFLAFIERILPLILALFG